MGCKELQNVREGNTHKNMNGRMISAACGSVCGDLTSYLGTTEWEPPCSHRRWNRNRQLVTTAWWRTRDPPKLLHVDVDGWKTRAGGATDGTGAASNRVVSLTTGTMSLWFSCHSWALPVWHRRTPHHLHWPPALRWLSNSPCLKEHTHTLVFCQSTLHENTDMSVDAAHLMKPTSSQLMLASRSLAGEEHTWRHLLWAGSKTRRRWSAELTWTAVNDMGLFLTCVIGSVGSSCTSRPCQSRLTKSTWWLMKKMPDIWNQSSLSLSYEAALAHTLLTWNMNFF